MRKVDAEVQGQVKAYNDEVEADRVRCNEARNPAEKVKPWWKL